MISKLRYFHGTGYDPAAKRPEELSKAVAIGGHTITTGIRTSIEAEGVLSLAGEHGDPTAGDPVEVDRL